MFTIPGARSYIITIKYKFELDRISQLLSINYLEVDRISQLLIIHYLELNRLSQLLSMNYLELIHLYNSNYALYSNILRFSLQNGNLTMGENVRYLKHKYDIANSDWSQNINILHSKVELYSNI